MVSAKKSVWFWIVVAILCVATIGITITFTFVYLGFKTYSKPEITRKTVEIIRQIGADQCSVYNVRFTPWKKIEIDSLKMSGLIGLNLSMNGMFDSVVIHYDIGTVLKYVYKYRISVIKALITGDINNIKVDKKIIVAEILPLIDNIDAKGKSVVFTNRKNSETFVFDQFTFNTKSSGWINPERKAHITSSTLIYGKWVLSHLESDLVLKGDSLDVRLSKADFLNGKLIVDANMGLTPLMIHHIDIKATDISVDDYCHVRKKYNDKISGIADINIKFGRGVPLQDSLHGSGKLTVRKVILKDLPVQKALVNLIGFPQLANTSFDSIVTDYTLMPGFKFSNVMKGTGPIINFSSSGYFFFDGRLTQQIDGKLTKEFVETLPGSISESMEPTSDNGRKFKCRIYGSIDHPKMALSKETLQKAFIGAFDSVKKSIEEVFK